MAFEQATIKVEKEQEFGELRSAIIRAFFPENVQKYLKRVSKRGSGFAISICCWREACSSRVEEVSEEWSAGALCGSDDFGQGADERVLSVQD